MPELPDLQPGQVWKDNDPRNKGRLLRVQSVHAADDTHPEPYVRVTVERTSRNVRKKEVGEQRTIKQRRFRPTRNGYALVEHPQPAMGSGQPDEVPAYPEQQQPTGDAWNWGGTDMTPQKPDADA